MTLAQLLPQARFLLVTTPQPVAQKVARRAAEMATKVDLEIGGVIENMAGFVTPGGERFQLFGEGGGQALADELDVPLLGKVPLTMPLREPPTRGRRCWSPTPTTRRRRRSARLRAGSSRCSGRAADAAAGRRRRGRRGGAAGADRLQPPDGPGLVSARAWGGFLAVAFLWGIPYLFIRIAVDDGVPPVFLAWARVTLAAVVLLVLARRAGVLPSLRAAGAGWRPMRSWRSRSRSR